MSVCIWFVARSIPVWPRSSSLPDAIHHLMRSSFTIKTGCWSGKNPRLSGSLTLTLESLSSNRQAGLPTWQALMKGVDPWGSFRLTSMAGWARRRSITGESWFRDDAAWRAVRLKCSLFFQLTSRFGMFSRNFFTTDTWPRSLPVETLHCCNITRNGRRKEGGEGGGMWSNCLISVISHNGKKIKEK